MNVGFGLGMLALLAIGPLVAAYFLRRRQKPVKVSALFLWRTPDQRAEAGPRLERFSRELSLLLEILAVIAAALFLADVGCGAQAQQRHVVVVVDGSMSMSARRADGQLIAEVARAEAAKAVRDADANLLTLIESGVQPRVLAGPAEGASKALATLEQWRPRGAAHDFTGALTLAREIAGPGERIVVITDAVPEKTAPLPAVVEVRALGEARENVGIVAAGRADEGEVARISVRVANYTDGERTVPVTLSGEQQEGAPLVQHHRLVIPSGGSALLVAGFRSVAAVEVTLPEDALVEDGAVTLLPAPPRMVGVSLFGLSPAARAALERFVAVAPGVAPQVDGAALRFGARESDANVTFGAPGAQKTFVGPFFAERANPVLEDVQLAGVVWTAGENPPGRSLLSAGDTVLLSEEPDGTLHFNLELSRSNVQRTPGWPVLMGNLVRRARESLPGFVRKHLVLGEELPIVAVAGAKHALRGPGGERPLFGAGLLRVAPPSEPGRFELVRDGEVVDALEVLAVDPRESDLRTRSEGLHEATEGAVSSRTATHERAPWALIALLALLMIDFALTAGGLWFRRGERVEVAR